MKQHLYFMHPRIIESSYVKGWKSYRTLILGASLPCSLKDCPMIEACTRHSRDFDKACYWYRQFPERDDLRLSNSNSIEVDNFIEGNPAHHFTDFTKFMIGKQDEIPLDMREPFWNHVAFYNYDQNIHFTLNDNDSSDHAHDTEENFQAFMEVMEELKPEVVYVWFTQVRDILMRRHIEGLEEIDQLNVNGITVHRFIYRIPPTPHPEKVLKAFYKAFASDIDTEMNAEGYLLHALYRAQGYHHTLPYTPLCIKEEMIDFAQPYAWDKTLYVYLVQSLQKHFELDKAYEFIQQRWNKVNEFCVASNFYCGIEKCIPMHHFSPSELSFFKLTATEILKKKYGADKLDFVFVYLNEDTEKRAIASLFNDLTHSLPVLEYSCKMGLFLSAKDCPDYEQRILGTQRVKRIHLLAGKIKKARELVYVEMSEHAPIETIELYRNGEKVADSSFQDLYKRGQGERLLAREIMEENKSDTHKETLDILCQIGWIRELDQLNHYSIITDTPISLPGQNVEVNMMEKCIFATAPHIRGMIYTYLIHKLALQQKQIMNYFPNVSNVNHIKDEKRRAIDLIKSHKMCKQNVAKEGATKFCGNLIEEYISVLLKRKDSNRS